MTKDSRAAGGGKTAEKKKPRGKPFKDGPDERRNLLGAPKRGESWAEVIKFIFDQTPQEMMEMMAGGDLLAKLKALPQGVTLKYLTVLQVAVVLARENNLALWQEVMDRADGPTVPEETGGSGEWVIRFARPRAKENPGEQPGGGA